MKDIFSIMYIIVDKRGTGDISTLNATKKYCISAFLKGTSINWNAAKKLGWKCVKVDVNIMTSSNEL